jgi:hypothetical protein
MQRKPQPRLFVVALDVQNCFDRMRRDALWGVISRAFQHEDYTVQKCAVVYPTPSGGRKRHSDSDSALSSMPALRSSSSAAPSLRFEHSATAAADTRTIVEAAADMVARRHLRGALLQVCACPS